MGQIFTSFMALFLLAQSAHAISFGIWNFQDPDTYFGAGGHSEKLEQASKAVVLIGGRASGVVVSPDGLVMTVRHAISDMYVSETENCPKLAVFLNHEKTADGRVDAGLTKFYCEKILVNQFSNDFALIKLKVPAGYSMPYVELARDENEISVGMKGFAIGHPHASSFSESLKKVTDGPVILYEPKSEELPHFLHLIDTEGGHSGAPIFNASGKLVGIHFRGLPNFGPGVLVTMNGRTERLYRFNVAISVPYLAEKYAQYLK